MRQFSQNVSEFLHGAISLTRAYCTIQENLLTDLYRGALRSAVGGTGNIGSGDHGTNVLALISANQFIDARCLT